MVEPAEPTRRSACTIVARNYLAQAQVLANSYLKHHPGHTFYVLVVDGVPHGFELGREITVIGPDALRLDRFEEFAFQYDVTELCTAVKPALLSLIIDTHKVEQVIYLDPDMAVFRPLDEMWELVAASTIVLIPHLLDPIPLDGLRPSEQDILTAGAYNLGFIGLRASTETRRFLRWWGERLERYCVVDPAHGLFVDQKWIDLVPGVFAGTSILRDPTYDVAYWNLHSRALDATDSGATVDGRGLALFHFSGFDPLETRRLSKHQDRLAVVDHTPLASLLDDYSQAVHDFGFSMTREWPYGYARFDNQQPISLVHRRLYANLDARQRARLGNPFRASGADSFFAWSIHPAPGSNGMTPFLDRLLIEAPDARMAFPNARGQDRQAFLIWAQTHGARAFGFDPRLADPSAPKSTPIAAPKAAPTAPTPIAAEDDPRVGVNVIGYLRNETGIGAVARGFIRALKAKGIPLSLTDVSELSPNRSQDGTPLDVDGLMPYAINLVCVNADQHFVVKRRLGEHVFNGRYNIGVWFWEQPDFPAQWHDRFAEYDEIWGLSTFITTTLARVSPIPVVHIPPLLIGDTSGSRDAGRQHLNVAPSTFVFLLIFDFASFFQRKNPLAVIEAFIRAFEPSEDVQLVIKCVNDHLDPLAFATMHELARTHRVSIHSGYWTSEEVSDLMAACDAYVSLHRAEGLGMTLADAMAAEKPVIATPWSGNADFMSAANSFPVAYELVELSADVGPYRAGLQWAEPSVDDAARLMRLVRDQPELARERAQAARRDLLLNNSAAAVGAAVLPRLANATRARRSRPHNTSDISAPLDTHSSSVHPPAVPPMDLAGSSHGVLGVLGKRVMNALLRYHMHYQGEINVAFANYLRQFQEKADELAATVARHEAYFSERPYVARDDFGTRDQTRPMGYQNEAGTDRSVDATAEFADLFRGSEQFIADRQRVYLPFFDNRRDIVDLGSGRGEFLELLRSNGIEATGVELDGALAQRCRERGLRVEASDAIDYLSSRSESSVDAIFSAQFIEHLDSAIIPEFLRLAHSRLRAGGILIAETVNPESHLALKTFYMDLTHQRPIFPHVLLFESRQAGFSSARVFYPTAGGFTQVGYRDAGEYAIIATK